MKQILKEIGSLQKEIESYGPLNANFLEQIRNYYKIGLTYTSNALEGNTLTESETKIVLEEGITVAGKPLKDHLEAIGHADAYEFLFTLYQEKSLQEDDIKHLHKLIYFRIGQLPLPKGRSLKGN